MEIINTNYETLRLTLCLAGGVITLLLSVVAYFLSKQSRLNIGGSAPAPKLTHVDVDWANSPWNSGSSPTIRIRANLDANEINRIFGLLPTVVDGQSINVVSNPGYATCDKTIAQNKGWTVL